MVELGSEIELLVVHRALMASRFTETPSDPVLLGSTFLAAIHSSILDELIAYYRNDAKFGDAARWNEWREMSSDRIEWEIVFKRLSGSDEPAWRTDRDIAEKRDHVRTCLEPFRVSSELVAEMISNLDAAAEDGSSARL